MGLEGSGRAGDLKLQVSLALDEDNCEQDPEAGSALQVVKQKSRTLKTVGKILTGRINTEKLLEACCTLPWGSRDAGAPDLTGKYHSTSFFN